MAFEFHISKAARTHYEFDRALFQTSGNVILPDFRAARAFALRMNERADRDRYPDRVVHAAQLNAMGLIDEILHHAVEIYRRTVNPNLMADAVAALASGVGQDRLDKVLLQFVEQFPSLAVYRDGATPAAYLEAATDGIPNRQIALEEMLMLWLANENPAFATFDELFDDDPLAAGSDYDRVMEGLRLFFDDQPKFGPEGMSLIAFLRSPALAEPDSLAGQLRYMRSRWGLVLTPFLDRLVLSLDVLHEEEVALWMVTHPGPAPASTAPGLGGLENEYERFSADSDWMPQVVLMAKTTYVWLDQLSRQYGREIRRLDQIPDEELDLLAGRGFTALWLIGLWERSRASQRIKQWRGNPEAAASAYSLMDYTIADELGGEESFRNLRDRCWARGIRLSSDMVPNHMGIDSRWVIEHPERFLQLSEPPYPSYTFTGGNLSDDDRVAIQIEDHYWNSTDAAVVFKRTDTWTGEARYIYHGNDGTSMPWNDTAQLDYLNGDVREAVIQTILHVARQFPIIRFDAAMTLARRHIQRLWYPEPGQGGGIPSRAEHAVSREEFNARMPEEFWREVVDRVAAEVPDTLLLAEAFWLLEGYFVRTLGMHRVYNSAFMNMLRDEDNASYRRVIKDTLEFDPQVLKRYVNFMNNPDERTAVDQFGKGDKYFGVATLLATMPGLPMIGHGQVEGYAEKYGMEYRRAYRDEHPDQDLVDRHGHDIFPLFHRRYLFAEADDFLLYDVFDPGGWVNDDVFAYSNRRGEEAALVVYHNKFAQAKGWIRSSAAYSVPDGQGARRLVQRSLGEGLGLHCEGEWYTVMREQRTGLEFIRRSEDLCRDGLFVDLHAYECQVFLDVHEMHDGPSGQLRKLWERLGGAGVAGIGGALRAMQLEPFHAALSGLEESDALARLGLAGAARARAAAPKGAIADVGIRAEAAKPARNAGAAGVEDGLDAALDDAVAGVERMLRALVECLGEGGDVAAATAAFRRGAEAALRVPGAGDEPLAAGLADSWTWAGVMGRLLLEAIDAVAGPQAGDLQLDGRLVALWRSHGLDEAAASRVVALLHALESLPSAASLAKLPAAQRPAAIVRAFVAEQPVRDYLEVNVWEGVTWFSREAFERLAWWVRLAGVQRALADATLTAPRRRTAIADSAALATALSRAGKASEYRLDRLESAAAE